MEWIIVGAGHHVRIRHFRGNAMLPRSIDCKYLSLESQLFCPWNVHKLLRWCDRLCYLAKRLNWVVAITVTESSLFKNTPHQFVTLFCSATVASNFCSIHINGWTSSVITVTWCHAFIVRLKIRTLWSHCHTAMFANRRQRWLSGHSIRRPHWNH